MYADLLMERGDPRGEFIALQCRAHPTEAERQRAKELLKAHLGAWLGDLALVFVRSSVVFERGFPASGTIREHWDLAPLVGNLGFGTLRHLDVSLARGALALLRDPICRSLASLRCVDGVPLFERGPEGLVALGMLREPGEDARGVVAAARGLPALRRLSAPLARRHDELAWLLDGPLGERLEQLDVGECGDRRLPELLAAWRERLVRREGPLARVVVGHAGARATLALQRADDGVSLHVSCGSSAKRELDALAGLVSALPPRRFVEVEVSLADGGKDSDRARLAAAVARLAPERCTAPWEGR